MGTSQAYHLDHLVLLLPFPNLTSPPPWLTSAFNPLPGGRHADNKTSNLLIPFQDGTYLELIAFIHDDPERRRGHWWDKPFGIIDYALGTSEALDWEALVRRLDGTGVGYAPPKAGGRKRDDGVELEWEVTFPQGVERGCVPFFCTDVTDRGLRVPAAPAHPSGVEGMVGVEVQVPDSEVQRMEEATRRVVGSGMDVGVPKGEGKVWIRVVGGGEVVRLTLVLRTRDEGWKGREIRETVGDGEVRIRFE